jgi:beta-glucosidase
MKTEWKTMQNNIKEIISKMTLEEKAGLCSGLDFWHTKGIERLGIPSVMMTDGPHGLRKLAQNALDLDTSIPATCFPAGAALACSWDRELLRCVGTALERMSQGAGIDPAGTGGQHKAFATVRKKL